MNNLSHIFKNKASFLRVFRGLHRVNPFREWFIGLCLCVLVIIFGGLYALKLFLGGYSEAPADTVADNVTIRYDSEKVREVLEIYKLRKAGAVLYESEKVDLPPPTPVKEESKKTEESVDTPVAQKPEMQVE